MRNEWNIEFVNKNNTLYTAWKCNYKMSIFVVYWNTNEFGDGNKRKHASAGWEKKMRGGFETTRKSSCKM